MNLLPSKTKQARTKRAPVVVSWAQITSPALVRRMRKLTEERISLHHSSFSHESFACLSVSTRRDYCTRWSGFFLAVFSVAAQATVWLVDSCPPPSRDAKQHAGFVSCVSCFLTVLVHVLIPT
ncbi:unnamed protein product, partial [Ectocarpus sp. 4 AP-2014]